MRELDQDISFALRPEGDVEVVEKRPLSLAALPFTELQGIETAARLICEASPNRSVGGNRADSL